MSESTKGKAAVSNKNKAKKAPTYKPLMPNAVTIAAIREARRGGLRRYSSVKALLK
jgi:hypothetical protein